MRPARAGLVRRVLKEEAPTGAARGRITNGSGRERNHILKNGTLSLAVALLALALSACTSSSTAEPAKTCADFCGAGNVCVNGSCVPLACTPACGPGTACQNGQCVQVQALSCATTYPGCSACDTSPATPAWVGLCGSGTQCDAASDRCVPVTCTPACGAGFACQGGTCVPSASYVHASMTQAGLPLAGPFPTGYSVTAACVKCHESVAAEVMSAPHWKWQGPTPDLVLSDLVTPLDPGNIGKVNLINNFCVGVPSNEKRCDQCHTGYGGDPDAAKPQKSARAYTGAGDSSIPLDNRVDCLVCHVDATRYSKNPKDFGRPNPTVDLAAAVKSGIILPTRANCGVCHFYAGGGDNVKLMGSALKSPTESTDVHMGRGMTCSDCHVRPGHAFAGGGVHVPTHTSRVACSDCHGATPHTGHVAVSGEILDRHMARIACQTCHIPRFSKTQFTKMNWDWSTAGDNKTCAGTPGTCTSGVVTTKVNDDGQPDPSSATSVTSYDYIKGNFQWKRNVVPAYRWSNGKSSHARVSDKGDLTTLGLTTDDPSRITLGEPAGNATNGKIMPFKLMRGRQPVYVDGANGFVINPNVFGPGSFWGVVQAPGYDFSTYTFDAGTAPGQPSVDKLWGKILSVGAVAAGQVPAGTLPFAKYDGTGPGYAWRYTKLYMDMNHEVAPKAQALGSLSAGGCADCHSASPRIPICDLYPNAAVPPRSTWFTEVVCP